MTIKRNSLVGIKGRGVDLLPDVPKPRGTKPKKPTKEIRANRITLKLTDAEYERFQKLAGRVPLGTYLYDALREHEDMRPIFKG